MPSASRGRGSGTRFSRTRLALPWLISISTRLSRSVEVTAARRIARCAPCLISGASVATRWLPNVATYAAASTRLVLPWPFAPVNVDTPGASSRSAAA